MPATRPRMDTRTADDCLGVVLAGGRSRRMGRDKALLDWQGRTLLEHAVARFAAAGIAPVVVSGERPAQAGIPDTHAEAGPLAGLLAVARAHPGRWLVAVPVDMPLLPAAWLAQLAREGAHAQAAHYADAPLPLAFRASPEVVAGLQAQLDDPQAPRSLHRWLAGLDARRLVSGANAVTALANANTPEDWEAIQR